jgi:hypothetical protein
LGRRKWDHCSWFEGTPISIIRIALILWLPIAKLDKEKLPCSFHFKISVRSLFTRLEFLLFSHALPQIHASKLKAADLKNSKSLSFFALPSSVQCPSSRKSGQWATVFETPFHSGSRGYTPSTFPSQVEEDRRSHRIGVILYSTIQRGSHEALDFL